MQSGREGALGQAACPCWRCCCLALADKDSQVTPAPLPPRFPVAASHAFAPCLPPQHPLPTPHSGPCPAATAGAHHPVQGRGAGVGSAPAHEEHARCAAMCKHTQTSTCSGPTAKHKQVFIKWDGMREGSRVRLPSRRRARALGAENGGDARLAGAAGGCPGTSRSPATPASSVSFRWPHLCSFADVRGPAAWSQPCPAPPGPAAVAPCRPAPAAQFEAREDCLVASARPQVTAPPHASQA